MNVKAFGTGSGEILHFVGYDFDQAYLTIIKDRCPDVETTPPNMRLQPTPLLVWDVLQNRIPEMRSQIASILKA